VLDQLTGDDHVGRWQLQSANVVHRLTVDDVSLITLSSCRGNTIGVDVESDKRLGDSGEP
jgi:hypothetical protein